MPMGYHQVKVARKNCGLFFAVKEDLEEVYIVGVYCGNSDPNNSDEYLKMFIDEACELENNGILYEGNLYSVEIDQLSCDAPAKSFALCTIGM